MVGLPGPVARLGWTPNRYPARETGLLIPSANVPRLPARDPAALKVVLDQWTSGKRPLIEHDRDLLKRAMRAFRKRLGVTLLDAESSVGGGPMSGGRSSDIAGVSPPRDYPREIWLELARQGRLVNAGQNVFELPHGR